MSHTLDNDPPASWTRMILVPRADPADERSNVAQRVDNGSQRTSPVLSGARFKLQKAGLLDASVQARGDIAGQRKGSFRTLSQLDMVLTRFESESEIEKAKNELLRDFDFVPDLRAEVDPPKIVSPEMRYKLPRDFKPWPVVSGVQEGNAGLGGRNVLVGVLDSGIDAAHAALKHHKANTAIEFRYVSPVALKGYSEAREVFGFDTDGHGTHICGVIGGRRIGVAPQCNLHVASVIESETLRASLFRTAYGLDWLFDHFRKQKNLANLPVVINLSLCFFEDLMDLEQVHGWKLVLQRLITRLTRYDVLVVAAIGNRFTDNSDLLGFPAAFDNVFAVGAVDFEGRIAPFSNRVPGKQKPDIYGYGVDIWSSTERDKYGQSIYEKMSGTSMSAAYVTGIATLLRSSYPGASARDVKDRLLDIAHHGADGVPIARYKHWPHPGPTGV